MKSLFSAAVSKAATATKQRSGSPDGTDGSNVDGSAATPPPYTPQGVSSGSPPSNEPPVDISAAFANLKLEQAATNPDGDTCLAHLKLLHAFQTLKEDVGYTDGLFGIRDSLVNYSVCEGNSEKDPEPADPESARRETLSRLREKRWALYVARAVDRYEAWWATLDKRKLKTDDVLYPSKFYSGFAEGSEVAPFAWTEHTLPPLDVLMVMHAHMLNPRDFLEDCMRNGLRALWHAGFPWRLVNAAIDDKFAYVVSADCQARWCQTGYSWNNTDDPTKKSIKCPRCNKKAAVLWTTCGTGEGVSKAPATLDLTGMGYGDGKLSHPCEGCGTTITKELLSVANFVADAKNLLTSGQQMPGTILDPRSGMPDQLPKTPQKQQYWRERNPLLFPNRMIQHGMRSQVVELITLSEGKCTMQDVRKMVEDVLRDKDKLKRIDALDTYGSRLKAYRIRPLAQIAIRKMMSRYWENFSSFALDLSGAVMRQGLFVEKMYKIDWLHSPSAASTMARLSRKYQRFFSLMANNPGKVAVPTLDVDLAWHTQQLSPVAYYRYSVAKAGKFVDHDDKIQEEKLSEAFEWTSKAYQHAFGEVYSECTCWYCETVRDSHISPLGKTLGLSRQEKIAEDFHAREAAAGNSPCPPDNSAHISAHNAVRLSVESRAAAVHRARLDAQYDQACRRAEKKGRRLPPRETYYDHWGHSYYMYGPWAYPAYFYPGMYYGYGYGAAWAACGAGTCGAHADSISAGACGGPGGCGGCGSSGASASCGGCGSGAGGGCGGGGGGGCGGGGGGGGGGGCGGGGGGC